jgi:phosphatidylinositol alpha-1,6-mannosyltransferase
METLAEGVWRSLVAVDPQARLVALGRSNRNLLWWLPWALLRSAALLRRRQVGLVLTGDALTYAVLAPLLRVFRVPNATMVMGLDLTYESRLYRAIVHRALRKAPSVIAISAATAERAVEFGVSRDRVSVLRLGVQAPVVTAADRRAARAAVHARLGLEPDAIVLLTIGRLVRRKGAQWFVANVVPGLPASVHYVVAGDGADADVVRQRVADGGLQARVHVLGSVDDEVREELMRGADIVVQPNIRVPGDMEGFGLVTIEAAMRGAPVVASDLEGIKDAVVDGVTGVLVPPEDAGQWVATLTRLLADPEELEAMAARFQQATIDRYGEAAMAAGLQEILQL